MGTDLPAEPERPSIYGKARLQDGQFLCQDPKCPKYRSHGGPVRDIMEWVRRSDSPYVSAPLNASTNSLRSASRPSIGPSSRAITNCAD
jgi:hypothetical protein